MTHREAEEKLNDYLMNGVQAELYWAEEARQVAVMIGSHSTRTNSTRFSGLFGRLQEVFSERETLAVTKMFDRLSRGYPVRSIGAVLTILEDNIDYWTLPERIVLERCLISNGREDASELSNQDLSIGIIEHFRSTLPSTEKKEHCLLSASLDRVFLSRDKVHAHNEANAASSRTKPSWRDTKILYEYGKNFVETIAFGYLGIAAIITEPQRVPKLLELLMATANLTNDEFRQDQGNIWMIQRLRKELLLEEDGA